MDIKHLVHKHLVAKNSFNKNIKYTGVSFEEYCDYIYNKRDTGNEITNSLLFGTKIQRKNTFWFVQNVEEIFVDEVYKYKSKEKRPIIIDCGANIGLSIIYFKKLYPNSKVIAFEPDFNIFKVCQNNIDAFKLKDVEIINAAVWKANGNLSFLPDNSLGGKIVDGNFENEVVSQVKAVRLKKYLEQKVDFLKIDIEGAEDEVILDCKEQLGLVQNLFIEYHSQGAKPQNLDAILAIVKEAGFRYYIKEAWNNMRHPYINCEELNTMFYDLQLNIFAYKSC